ncbi:autotransporter outer membrane beta-barrel domain-containing protein [Sphingomonas oligophenolica]|uniref:Autotransporter domain-containing protein n=1 Tax=Sphingomonas oligophenolica TaxID=301154 RepID=A0A502CPQ4_9SPHN|nr:autotransporter domain-containing protein [Sphingomonas oligophenolica]TPG13691.1 autotransporter domain-containing protein [Sphingomonas oligophenolica]
MLRCSRALLPLLLVSVATPALAQTQPQARAGTTATAAKEPVDRIIVFGDSLADGGFFVPLIPNLPAGAGSFTTNPDPVAPEVMAARLGIDLKTAYGTTAAIGTNYAIGGARVTAANGASIPIASQLSGYLARGGTFGPRDLVYIQGGGNDYFAYNALGANNDAILTTAATQLAAVVQRAQAAGAQRIVTLAVQSGGAPALQLFNRTYAAALAGANVNALYFDTNKLFNEIVANAAAFGITNVTGQACTVSSSLFCTQATLVSPNANRTYVLADSVHPSGIVQEIQGNAIASLVRAPEQVAGLGYAAQSMFRAQRDLIEGAERGNAARADQRLALFGSVGYHYYSKTGSNQVIGITERGFAATLGADLSLNDTSGIGIAGGYGDGHGDFSLGTGSYRAKTWTVNGYARAGVGPFRVIADGTYGRINYDRISRRVQLGPVSRTNRGETDGDYVAGRVSAAVDLFRAAGVGVGPDVAVQYEKLTIDGYAEGGTTSTDVAFGRQRIQGWTGRAGMVARALPGSPVGFFARADYERNFTDDPRRFTITPAGAPISYTTSVTRADREYMSYAMGVDGQLIGPLSARAGVSGYALRDDRDIVTAFAGLSMAF